MFNVVIVWVRITLSHQKVTATWLWPCETSVMLKYALFPTPFSHRVLTELMLPQHVVSHELCRWRQITLSWKQSHIFMHLPHFFWNFHVYFRHFPLGFYWVGPYFIMCPYCAVFVAILIRHFKDSNRGIQDDSLCEKTRRRSFVSNFDHLAFKVSS